MSLCGGGWGWGCTCVMCKCVCLGVCVCLYTQVYVSPVPFWLHPIYGRSFAIWPLLSIQWSSSKLQILHWQAAISSGSFANTLNCQMRPAPLRSKEKQGIPFSPVTEVEKKLIFPVIIPRTPGAAERAGRNFWKDEQWKRLKREKVLGLG